MSATDLVVVTGAGGFIGSAVVAAVLASGRDVRALVGPPDFQGATLAPEIERAHAEITDARAMLTVCRGAQAVIHCAGPPSVAASFADPLGFAAAHALGTATVVAAARSCGIARLVHVSSAEVYGRSEGRPVREDRTPAPVSPYAAAKLAAEAFVRAAGARGDVEDVVLRPFSVYGSGSPATSLVGTVLRQALVGDEVVVRSLGAVRDYVHADDVASASVAALEHGAGGIFNIAGGEGVSVTELAAAAGRAVGREVAVRATGEGDRPAGSDLSVLVADVSAAREQLGWQACSLADGMRRTMTVLAAPTATD